MKAGKKPSDITVEQREREQNEEGTQRWWEQGWLADAIGFDVIRVA